MWHNTRSRATPGVQVASDAASVEYRRPERHESRTDALSGGWREAAVHNESRQRSTQTTEKNPNPLQRPERRTRIKETHNAHDPQRQRDRPAQVRQSPGNTRDGSDSQFSGATDGGGSDGLTGHNVVCSRNARVVAQQKDQAQWRRLVTSKRRGQNRPATPSCIFFKQTRAKRFFATIRTHLIAVRPNDGCTPRVKPHNKTADNTR